MCMCICVCVCVCRRTGLLLIDITVVHARAPPRAHATVFVYIHFSVPYEITLNRYPSILSKIKKIHHLSFCESRKLYFRFFFIELYYVVGINVGFYQQEFSDNSPSLQKIRNHISYIKYQAT